MGIQDPPSAQRDPLLACALPGAAGVARFISHPGASKTCPYAPGSKRECSGTRGGKAGLAVPPPHPERRIPCYWPGDKTPNPRRHSRGAPGAADTAGTWARPQRCAKHPLARPNLCSPASAPAGGERDPPPFHFAPVRGNLRSVTRILKRATCSAGRAALGGIGGLGRRGLGTPGSGGHAGVDAPRRPAAAAR